jgi:hypothetical protein
MLETEYYVKIFSRQITADKTCKITIESIVNVDNFVSNAESYANFVIGTCPNLTMLHFDMYDYLFHDAKDYVDEVNTLLRSFMNELLKPLDKGHSELKICLTWCGKCEKRNFKVRKGCK